VYVKFSYKGQPKEVSYILGIVDLDDADEDFPILCGGIWMWTTLGKLPKKFILETR